MKVPYLFVFILFISITSNTLAQVPQFGYIIEIRGDKVFTDLKLGDVIIGSKLQVIKEGGFFVHPVTGKRIKEEDEIIAILDIIDVKADYSIATVYPKEAITQLQKGTKVFPMEKTEQLNNINAGIFKKSIAVQPLTVLNIQGYLGIYVGDILTEQLLKNDSFRILDRQTLGLKADQIVTGSGGVLTESELLHYSSQGGADYYITGTMYEPDVVELSTGIPVKNIVSFVGHGAEAVTGKDLKINTISEFVPDKVDIKRLKAVVKISLRVVDVKTGEIKFLCTEMQQAEGESDINLEGGVLGGLKIRGGVTSFQNTITGKATELALKNLTGFIINYFNGKISEKTYTGNIIEISDLNKRIPTGGDKLLITKIIKKPIKILKTGNLINDTVYYATLNHGKDSHLKINNYLKVLSPTFYESSISGEKKTTKPLQVGYITIKTVFDKSSEGVINFNKNYDYRKQFDPNLIYAKKKSVWNTIYLIPKVKIWSKENLDSIGYNPQAKSTIGLGYMIYGGSVGGYIEVCPFSSSSISDPLGNTYQSHSILTSGGFVKKIGNKNALRIGMSIDPIQSLLIFGDVGFATIVNENLSIIGGISFGSASSSLGVTNVLFSFGLGYTF